MGKKKEEMKMECSGRGVSGLGFHGAIVATKNRVGLNVDARLCSESHGPLHPRVLEEVVLAAFDVAAVEVRWIFMGMKAYKGRARGEGGLIAHSSIEEVWFLSWVCSLSTHGWRALVLIFRKLLAFVACSRTLLTFHYFGVEGYGSH